MSQNVMCPRCNVEVEDMIYLFVSYPFSLNIWSNFPVLQVLNGPFPIGRNGYYYCRMWGVIILIIHEKVLFTVIPRNIWITRNNKALFIMKPIIYPVL